MFNQARLYAAFGVIFLVQSFSCLLAFCMTLKEKKSFAAALWALAVAFGAMGAALLTVYSVKEDERIKKLKKRIAEHDHWFHTFEYPACAEPEMDIEDFYVPPVETEEE